jgi:16S rRNA (adenine(1408)-N(1))-methyltransferase
LDNALFLQTSLETLGAELNGLADRVTVNYPWGSLLRTVALPDVVLLSKLASLAKPGGDIEILVNMQPLRDRANAARLSLAHAAILHGGGALQPDYAKAGLQLTGTQDVTGQEPPVTRWGRQLHFAGREICRLRAVRIA